MLLFLSDTSNPGEELSEKIHELTMQYDSNLAYISSSPQEMCRPWFRRTWDEYKLINSKIQMKYFDLSDSFGEEKLKEVLNYKIIHLSGGNTFEFLKNIRKRNFGQIINRFLKRDTLLIGVSAGSIIMTPRIDISIVANDKNESGMDDLTGLNLVDFEFYPHYKNSKEEFDNILQYSRNKSNNIFVVDDSSGICVDNNNQKLIGNVLKMKNGKVIS